MVLDQLFSTQNIPRPLFFEEKISTTCNVVFPQLKVFLKAIFNKKA